jgi:hypothetical protein
MAVEAARLGAMFSQYDYRRQYEAWRRKMERGKPRGLTGAALEHVIGALRASHPEYVVVEAQ